MHVYYIYAFLCVNFYFYMHAELHSDLEKIDREKPRMFVLLSSVLTWARSKPADPVSIFRSTLGLQSYIWNCENLEFSYISNYLHL